MKTTQGAAVVSAIEQAGDETMIYNISTTSRTGYQRQTAQERIRETVAILASIFVVGTLVAGIALASWYLNAAS